MTIEVKNLFEKDVCDNIVDRLQSLSTASVRQWGKMDVSQMLAHCSVAFKVPLSDKPLKPMIPIRWFAWAFKSMLYNNKMCRHGMPTSPQFIIKDERQFEQERTQLIALVRKFQEAGPGVAGKYPHPAFGHFTPEQWGKMMWKHLDHHLRQFSAN